MKRKPKLLWNINPSTIGHSPSGDISDAVSNENKKIQNQDYMKKKSDEGCGTIPLPELDEESNSHLLGDKSYVMKFNKENKKQIRQIKNYCAISG